MSDQNESKNQLVIPAFGKTPEIKLDTNATKEAELRFIEAKDVNPITYTDLEHTYNESYRELKRHHATVTYQIAMADKALEQAKATVLIDKYPDFMKDRPKSQDNADMRKAFLIQDPDYVAALDRMAMLKAIESFIDGRIKVLENICRYMRKRMDLVIRSGMTGDQLYVTSGKNKS